ncbi:MAG TPA: DmsE family decaheme c-type cytochrome [Acidisarcina sp.]|nr:DmsE family decaheme c-type cytochrome [Acidisarcina sp.]
MNATARLLRAGAYGFLAFTLGSCLAGGPLAHAKDAPKPQTMAATHQPAANPADYVGSDTCATCHADIAKGLGGNPHSKIALMHGDKTATCEGCHGAGKAHVDGGGDVTKIFRFTKANAKQIDDKCLGCHQGKHANFERSAHGEANVSCLNCHGIHVQGEKEHLLKASQPTLCYGCHTDIKPDFSKPFHHKVNEGLMKCSDCHDPHGTFQAKGLHTAAQGDAVCVKCHTETAGPFVYEHPPVKTEGCTSCHTPHGSPNPRLLARSNVNTLCMQCHTASSFTAPGIPSFHNQAVQYQACTICHTQVHGSNSNSFFFK